MNAPDILFLCAALFLANHIVHHYFLEDALLTGSPELIPFIMLLLTANMNIAMTLYTVFKYALILMLAFKIALMLRPMKKSSALAAATTLAVLCVIALNFIRLPGVVTNVLLILTALGHTTLLLIKGTHKTHREAFELSIVAFFASILLGIGNGIYTLFIGTALYCLYLMTALYISVKAFHKRHLEQEERLNDLEHRFSRTVDFEARRRTSQMADQVEHIREKSQKDPMTKALNRHGILDEINTLINDSSVKIFSLALIDIDYFKEINDTKGHLVGDDCLKFLSYTVQNRNRKTDVLGRYGGDEFILVMPHINAPVALEISERLRAEVVQKSVPRFTLSIGIATYPFDGRSFKALFDVADKGLYVSKESGRNRASYTGNVPLLKSSDQ